MSMVNEWHVLLLLKYKQMVAMFEDFNMIMRHAKYKSSKSLKFNLGRGQVILCY